DKIVLLINSEGGEVDGTKFLADTVRSLNTQIVAYIQGICCSGAYWVASQCDYILAENECSLIGSIGTQTIVVDDSEYLKNQGIKK
ncbi:S49 family peptidase, partial [Flammeovirga pacifica]|uniref:S49 family peptidase n=1 Tax=Flammeovirga pacifica TaxID=915059 RepID=UPI00157D0CBF